MDILDQSLAKNSKKIRWLILVLPEQVASTCQEKAIRLSGRVVNLHADCRYLLEDLKYWVIANSYDRLRCVK